MSRHITRWLGGAALLAVGAVATRAGAQAPSPARWQAWLGCWSPTPASEAFMPTSAPLVCVTPASTDAVNIATVADGKVVSTQRIDASGVDEPVDAKGCTGTQRAQWSADGRRVYLHAVATCDGLKRTTNGVLGITPAGEWLDVQEVSADSGTGMRVARYRDVGVPNSVPAEIASALSGRSTSVRGARVAAGAPIGSAAVIEASHLSTPGVVEAFLLERGQRFALSAHDLVALADAGVPGRITDAMVAVSNPQVFAVAHRDPRAARDSMLDDEVVGRRISVYMEPSYGAYPYGYGLYNYGLYNAYGPYGYLYGNGYGYGYPGYYYGAPVIVVTGNGARETPHGRMVKGGGYTGGEATGRTATPTTSRGSSSPSPSSSSAGSSSRGSSDGATRTAKPKP